MKGRTLDITPNGISIVVPEHIAPGQSCGLFFTTSIDGKMLEVKVIGKVVYSICVGTAGFRVGFQFVDPDAAARMAITHIMR